MPAPDRSYYPGVDQLRAFLAITIALYHFAYGAFRGTTAGAPFTAGLEAPAFGAVFSIADVTVQIFFIISGLVIANTAHSVSAIRFLKGRMVRLYPAVWICAPLTFLAWVAIDPAGMRGYGLLLAKSLTLFPAGAWIDPPYWTIGVEIMFYAFIGLFVLAVTRRRIEIACLTLLAGSAFFWLAMLATVLTPLEIATFERDLHRWRITPFYYGPHFAIGMLLWLVNKPELRRTAIAGLAVAVALGVLEIAGTAGLAGRGSAALAGAAADNMARLLFWGLLVVVAILVSRPSATVADKGAWPVTRVAGLMTYPLYLIHFGVGLLVMRQLRLMGLDPWLAILGTMAVVIAFAVLLALRVEPVVARALGQRIDALVARRLTWLARPGMANAQSAMGAPIATPAAPPDARLS
jgi:peptidoglycan/LPS O-acetylase OafA/YrhL